MDFFDIHTHSLNSSENVFSILNAYPNSTKSPTPFSIGIHPWFIHLNKLEEELLIVEEKSQLNNCLAIGECGLDKLVKIDFELQKQVFKKQIELSEKCKKPLIIHCVKSYQEIIEIKKELKPKQTWILHGFNKNKQVANSLLKNEILVSFGEAIIKNKKLQEVGAQISLDKILLETDNSSIEIAQIYQKISKIKDLELLELQQKIKQNFKRIFKR
jgi:TatD DNase family protein